MKKRIVMLLCTAALTLGIAAPPAMASGGPFYPIKVEEYTYGPLDELRISKVYQLSLADDPSSIPTEGRNTTGHHRFRQKTALWPVSSTRITVLGRWAAVS